MINFDNVKDFIQHQNYDIHCDHNSRWIDQKCTPDVISIIADCICHYVYEKNEFSFTSKDVWYYKYAVENIELIFKKPGVESLAAKSEYDKFFQQPMELMAYSGILSKSKQGMINQYTVENIDILEYLSSGERQSLNFLTEYISKFINDNGISELFDKFFCYQNKNTYCELKKGFTSFMITNTRICNHIECWRIFTKVINPLAFRHNSLGTYRGRISKCKITFDMLMYNRDNFRDIYANKPREMTRNEYLSIHPIDTKTLHYYAYQAQRAKDILKRYINKYHNGKSEWNDGTNSNDKAIHMHHIFPASDYPVIQSYIENLIALTPSQHYLKAHPNGNTQCIDRDVQRLLLLSKTDSIRTNLTINDSREIIYSFKNFVYVLNVGFDSDFDIEDMNFVSVVNAINVYYGESA